MGDQDQAARVKCQSRQSRLVGICEILSVGDSVYRWATKTKTKMARGSG